MKTAIDMERGIGYYTPALVTTSVSSVRHPLDWVVNDVSGMQ